MSDHACDTQAPPAGSDGMRTRAPAPFLARRLEAAAEQIIARPGPEPASPALLGLTALALDLVALAAAAFVSCAVTALSPHPAVLAAGMAGAAAFLSTGLAVAGGLDVASLRDPARSLPLAIACWSAVCIGLMLAILPFEGTPDGLRAWSAVLYAAGLCTLAGGRFAMAGLLGWLSVSGRLARRAVLVGGGPAAQALGRALERRRDEVKLLGTFDDRAPRERPEAGFLRLGSPDDLHAFARRTRVDLVVLCLPVTGDERGTALLRQIGDLPAEIRLAAYQDRLRLRPRCVSRSNQSARGPLPGATIDWDLLAKHGLDRCAGALLLALSLPLLAGLALLLRLDGGPVLARSTLRDFSGRPLQVWRFACGEQDGAARGVRPWLRRSGLVRLPALFDLARGAVSLVGPSPRADDDGPACSHRRTADFVLARCGLKPGLLAPPGISARAGAEAGRRAADAEIAYSERRSMVLDILILARATATVLGRFVARPAAA